MKKFNSFGFGKTCFMLMGAFALFVLIAVAFLLVSVDLKAADKPAKASTEQSKALVRRIVDEVFNKWNLAAIDEIYSAKFVHHEPGAPPIPPGPEGVKQALTMYRAAFPDLKVTIEDMFAEGDRVATRYTARGTHKGEMMGIAPTGKQVTFTGIIISHIAKGKVEEEWENWDAIGLMQQLGVIPPMGGEKK